MESPSSLFGDLVKAHCKCDLGAVTVAVSFWGVFLLIKDDTMPCRLFMYLLDSFLVEDKKVPRGRTI